MPPRCWRSTRLAWIPGRPASRPPRRAGRRLMPASCGCTAMSPWKPAIPGRCVYAGVVEHSVYVDPAHHGRGIGSGLLTALTGSTEADGIWTIQSGVFADNIASVRLHERAGFRVVGTRERLGRHHGQWRDVVQVERRSSVTGIS